MTRLFYIRPLLEEEGPDLWSDMLFQLLNGPFLQP